MRGALRSSAVLADRTGRMDFGQQQPPPGLRKRMASRAIRSSMYGELLDWFSAARTHVARGLRGRGRGLLATWRARSRGRHPRPKARPYRRDRVGGHGTIPSLVTWAALCRRGFFEVDDNRWFVATKIVTFETPLGYSASRLPGRYTTATGPGDRSQAHPRLCRSWVAGASRPRRVPPPAPAGRRNASAESWQVPLLSLHWLLKYAVHLGGENALDVAGYAHYLSLGGRSRIHLYGDVPSWLKRLPIRTQVVVRRRKLFGDEPVGIDSVRLEGGRPARQSRCGTGQSGHRVRTVPSWRRSMSCPAMQASGTWMTCSRDWCH